MSSPPRSSAEPPSQAGSAQSPAPSSAPSSCNRSARAWCFFSSTHRPRTSWLGSSLSSRSDSIQSYVGDRGDEAMAVSPLTQAPAPVAQRVPLVELRGIRVAFGGVRAVDGVTIDLYPGEVVGVVGGNGAGKTTLMRTLSGARPPDSGQIFVSGQPVTISNPRDAKALGVETIYQTLALADNLDAPANVFLGRELTGGGALDDSAMESATRKVIGRLNPNFKNFKSPVLRLSGGQRQAVAIARAIHFNARALIMDEPTAAFAPAATAQVHALIRQLKSEGIGIFLVSHDIHDVFDLSERISVVYHGKLVGTVNKNDVTTDEVLGMIILGKPPTKLTRQELAELHG